MSRDDGFTHADIDVGLLNDPKVRALIRSTNDEATILRCLVAYTAALLTSWDRGERVTLEDAAPLWMTAIGDVAKRLEAVGLLDPDGRIPEKPWAGWFAPAAERRLAVRRKTIFAGLVSRGMTAAEANVEADRRTDEERVRLNLTGRPSRFNSKAQPKGSTLEFNLRAQPPTDIPVRQTDSHLAPAGARDGQFSEKGPTNGLWDDFDLSIWGPFKEAWEAKGFKFPPTIRQRELLWPIADARPNDLGRWTSAARSPKSADVVGYVLAEWKRLQGGS